MKLLVNPTSYANAIDLIASGVHQISVGTHETSVRNSCNLSLKEIQKLVENKKNTEVLILVNKLFFEPEIANLEKFIINVSKLKIDGLIFADYAIPQIVDEQNIKNIKLIYNPETLVTSHGQFDFYLENNITEVSLAREIIGREVDEIIKNKGQMKIQLPVAGYSYMMLSRWDLLTNFKASHKINDELTNKKLYLKEKSRKHEFIVYEDHNGTHMFTGYSLNLLDKLQGLYDNGLDVIRIDTFLHDDKWTSLQARIYMEAISKLENKTYTNEFITNSNQALRDLLDEYQSHGFYTALKEDLIYLDNYTSEANND